MIEGEVASLAWIAAVLGLSVVFATLRSALSSSHHGRIMARARNEDHRARIERLLGKEDSLATSAGVIVVALDLLFMTLVLGALQGEASLGWGNVGLALAIVVPVLLLLTDALPSALARHWGDMLLLRTLPFFYILQLPVGLLVPPLHGTRRAMLRTLGLREKSHAKRQIVEGLREVIEESDISGDLDDSEREMIENVMEFRDVDVAAVMTPRTEIHGVDVEDGLNALVREAAECGHSRIPVYENSLDTIIGTLSARDVVQVVAENQLASASLREILHPPYFVPETKRVSELLTEFRDQKVKMAIVLDEYGGTAGLVTLGDVIAEIVGDIHDEFDEETPVPVRKLEGGVAEVEANVHVSEVNELLELAIPEEEDYETLGGYVLAVLGRFPKQGESFVRDDIEYAVIEASDRRVLKVRIRHLANEAS